MTDKAPLNRRTADGAALSELLIAAAASFRADGRARPRMTRTLLQLGRRVAALSVPDDSASLAPASRWFYDNARMLEEACLDALDALRRFEPLPAQGRTLRAMKLCRELCAQTEARVDPALFESAVGVWQEVRPLEEQELSQLPLLMRLALLELLSSLARQCAQEERDRRAAESGAKAPAKKRSDAYLFHRLTLLEETQDQGGMAALDAYLAARHDSARQLCAREQTRQMRQCLWVSNAITSLRALSAHDWRDALERLSSVHRALLRDPSGVYPDMDRTTRAMYRARAVRLGRIFRVSQRAAAGKAVALCEGAQEGLARHVGYYLLDEGQPALWAALGRAPFSLRAGLWLGRHAALIYVTLITLGSLLTGGLLFLLGVRHWLTAPALLIGGEGFRQLAGLLLHRLSPPKMLPRMKPGCLGEGGVLVAVPTLLCSREQALAMARHLSVLRLANPEKKLSYLLLADFKDGPAAEEPGDSAITEEALAAVSALNEVWGGGFYYLHRAREWNEGEKRFMGRERKRGALEALNRALLEGEFPDPLAAQTVDPAELAGLFPTVITLDSDTMMPPGAALKLAGALRHPLNRNFAVLQPRMEQSAASIRTRIARIFGGQGGFDPYLAAFADVYQNVCGEGSFAGKGAYDAARFYSATRGKIRENSVLSHDLLEGALAGSATAGDVAFFDSEPASLSGWARRLHRWTRGDWQLLPWLLPKVKGPQGWFKNPLSLLNRFKIMDNLRRSLVPAAAVLLLLFGAAEGLPAAFLAGLLLPHAREILLPSPQAAKAALYRFILLPFEAYRLLDAAFRTLWRMLVSHRRLLEWTPSAEAERMRGDGIAAFWPNALAALAMLALCRAHPLRLAAALPVAVLWLLAPLAAKRLNAPEEKSRALSAPQKDLLRDVAARTLRFFEATVTEETHFLPPDNLQLDPDKGAAPRTSPTNIGMYLLSLVCARELELMTADEICARMDKTVSAMETLETWRGHLLNWYDVRTLDALARRYVSTVDSGNLCACLLLCAQALRARLDETDAAFRALPARLDALAGAMDFSALYDENAELFYIGMDLETLSPGASHYDLLASEARLTSFLAVMRREAPVRHWRRLGRALTRSHGGAALLSWSGTLFEYLLPALFLDAPRGTLLGESCRAAAKMQLRAFETGPWGVSESGYYAFDPELSYQYHAFGLPRLSLRTERASHVVAPYASALALSVLPREAAQNLEKMRLMGWLSELGFYEAADYDPSRIPENEEYMLVKSHMAHHQGMTLAAICNALCGNVLTRYFRALPQAEAYALLLEERAPGKKALRAFPRVRRQNPRRPDSGTAQRCPDSGAFPCEAQVMAGGGMTYAVDARGRGFLSVRALALTCRVPDPFLQQGPQVYLAAQGAPESIGAYGSPWFARGRAVYTLERGGLRAEMTCFVSPLDGAAMQLVEARNTSAEDAEIALCSFLDVCIAPQEEFEGHPAFQRLLIETAAPRENLLLARRRTRHDGESFPLVCHACFAGGEAAFSYETDRAAFLRRGEITLPSGCGRTGAVIDPCLSVCARLKIPAQGARRVWFLTAAVEDEAQALRLAARYETAEAAAQALALSEVSADVTARGAGLNESAELAAQRMAAHLICPSPRPGTKPAAREELWRFSISGDLPLMTVLLRDERHAALARQAVRAHAYLTRLGLRFDLALVNLQSEGYFQPLRDALLSLLASCASRDTIGRPGGVTLVDAGLYPPHAVEALLSLSALELDGNGGSAARQLALMESRWPAPETLGRRLSALRPAHGTPALDNGYGGFLSDGGYLCYRQPPAAWANVMANPRFGAVMTDRGAGFVYAANSRLRRLTALFSDPVLDCAQEGFWLRDEETGDYSPLLLEALAAFYPGRMRFRCDALSLRAAADVFVDAELPVRAVLISLENPSDAPRRLSVTACARFLLGSHRRDAMQARCRAEGGVCTVESPVVPEGAFLCMAHREVEASANAAAFFGAGGMSAPRGMSLAHLDEGDAGGPFGAVRRFLTLNPKETADICVLLGADEPEKALHAFCGGGARLRLARLEKEWDARLSALRVSAPDPAVSLLLSTWLPAQLLCSRVRAKAGFQQAGGATGFRDQLQDMLALRYTDPAAVRAHLLEAAAHQFEAGDVQHWWHEPALGVRTRISDDKLFLPYAAAEYIEATGDMGVLDETAPYLTGLEISEGREDCYGSAERSEAAGTLRQHCLRAIESVQIGAHGLPLMGAGDWNDGMSRVGVEGRGESVWLGFFLAETLRRFAPLCPEETHKALLARREALLAAAEKHAWTGGWYARAWFDSGEILGAPGCAECEIDLTAQVWAVFAGAAHAREALESALDRLVDREHGIVRLLDPPFDGAGDPGYIRAYPPGVRENGGQYTHAACWLVMACAQEGLTAQAWEIFRMLLPTSHTRSPEEVRLYLGEPFVVAADVSACENAGRAGWTWYTGSAGLLLRAGLEALCGFEKRGARARLRPTAPEDWEGFTLEYRYGGTRYLFRALRGKRDDGWVDLVDDGRVHEHSFALK